MKVLNKYSICIRNRYKLLKLDVEKLCIQNAIEIISSKKVYERFRENSSILFTLLRPLSKQIKNPRDRSCVKYLIRNRGCTNLHFAA